MKNVLLKNETTHIYGADSKVKWMARYDQSEPLVTPHRNPNPQPPQAKSMKVFYTQTYE
jgi:hypothetical protein